LKYLEPDAADRFYKALVRRCRKTEIGAKADRLRWFPELDAEGNLRRSRFELMELPGAQELGSGGGISGYPIPGKVIVMAKDDRVSDIVAAVKRLGFSITARDIYDANAGISRWENNAGREVLIPHPRETRNANPEAPEESPSVISDPPPPPPVVEIPDSDQGDSYIVISGDTVVKVAMQFGISLKNLLDANPDLDSRRLKIGQKIRIPVKEKL